MKRLPSVRALFSAFWDAFLPENVVLVQAMGLCPILAVGYDLKYGLALAVCVAIVLIPANLLLSVLGNKIPQWVRPPLYAVVTTILLLAAAFLLRQTVSADIYAVLYLFIPLMAVDTLFTVRAAGKQIAAMHPLLSVADSLGMALGFALVICAASALREIAIDGTVWDIPLGITARFPEAKHPFIGFVLLGFMAAALQWLHQLWRRLLAGKEASS